METSSFKNNIEIVTLNKPGITDFAKARNDLLEKARVEWVFFLDSDERMSSELKRELLKLFSTSEVEQLHFSGFYVKRRSYFLGQYIGTDRILRLIKKGSGYWERRVHEVYHMSDGRVGQLKNPIIHNTSDSVAQMVDKINQYSTLHAKANRSEGKRSDLFKIIFYPKVKFIQSLMMGRGMVFSILQALHSFLAWSKLWISQKG